MRAQREPGRRSGRCCFTGRPGPTPPISFRVYSANPDIERLPTAHRCKAVQPEEGVSAQIRRRFACLWKAPPVGFEPTHTAPEAVVRSRLNLDRLLGKTLAGPRLVRRALSVRFSGGFAGRRESVTGHLSGPYAALAARSVQIHRRVSVAVVSAALARSAACHDRPWVPVRCQPDLPET